MIYHTSYHTNNDLVKFKELDDETGLSIYNSILEAARVPKVWSQTQPRQAFA